MESSTSSSSSDRYRHNNATSSTTSPAGNTYSDATNHHTTMMDNNNRFPTYYSSLTVRLLLSPWEYLVTINHSSLWQKHVAWAKPDGAHLKQYITGHYSSNMVLLSLLLTACISVFFNSSQELADLRKSLGEIGIGANNHNHNNKSNPDAFNGDSFFLFSSWTTSSTFSHHPTIPNTILHFLSTLLSSWPPLKFWIGLILLLDIFVTLMGLIATFTLWGMIAALSDTNAHCVLRSTLGQYAMSLPPRLVVASLYIFLLWTSLFVIELVVCPLSWILVVGIVTLFLGAIVIPLSALGRLILQTGAMAQTPILPHALEQQLLPSGLQASLLLRALHRQQRQQEQEHQQQRRRGGRQLLRRNPTDASSSGATTPPVAAARARGHYRDEEVDHVARQYQKQRQPQRRKERRRRGPYNDPMLIGGMESNGTLIVADEEENKKDDEEDLLYGESLLAAAADDAEKEEGPSVLVGEKQLHMDSTPNSNMEQFTAKLLTGAASSPPHAATTNVEQHHHHHHQQQQHRRWDSVDTLASLDYFPLPRASVLNSAVSKQQLYELVQSTLTMIPPLHSDTDHTSSTTTAAGASVLMEQQQIWLNDKVAIMDGGNYDDNRQHEDARTSTMLPPKETNRTTMLPPKETKPSRMGLAPSPTRPSKFDQASTSIATTHHGGSTAAATSLIPPTPTPTRIRRPSALTRHHRRVSSSASALLVEEWTQDVSVRELYGATMPAELPPEEIAILYPQQEEEEEEEGEPQERSVGSGRHLLNGVPRTSAMNGDDGDGDGDDDDDDDADADADDSLLFQSNNSSFRWSLSPSVWWPATSHEEEEEEHNDHDVSAAAAATTTITTHHTASRRDPRRRNSEDDHDIHHDDADIEAPAAVPSGAAVVVPRLTTQRTGQVPNTAVLSLDQLRQPLLRDTAGSTTTSTNSSSSNFENRTSVAREQKHEA